MNLEKSSRLFQLKQTIRVGIENIIQNFFSVGNALWIIKKERLWRLEDSHSRNFRSWIENELNISASTAYQLIAIYERFHHLQHHLDGITYSHLTLILPHTTDQTPDADKLRLIDMCRHLPIRAAKDNLRELLGKTPTDLCEHPAELQEMWNRCKKCGKFWR